MFLPTSPPAQPSARGLAQMARIRSIKPEFPQSESIGRLSRDARLLFIQLWTVVDDEGRTRAASRMLASLLYPYDDDAPKLIDEWLSELEAEECIQRYDVDGARYLVICNWLKHQKIDKPSKSRLPSPPEIVAKPREASRSLAPDLGSRILDQDLGSGPRTDARETRERSRSSLRPDWPPNYREQFWEAYPHKVGKPPALKALDKLAKARDGPAFDAILNAVYRYAAKDDDRPWCNPATYLNHHRWLDQPAKSNGHGYAKPQRKTVHDVFRELAERDGDEPGAPNDWLLPFG